MESVFTKIRLSELPGYARLFVGMVTFLMLAVTFWVMLIFNAEKGQLDTQNLPSYLSAEQEERIRESMPTDSASEKNGANTSDERIYGKSGKSKWRRNLGMAHTHINGQTLLFFALGALFLFTSVSAGRKKMVYLLFSGSILMHAIGLSGEGFYSIFDDLLAISGFLILMAMLYMSLMIYIDLCRKRTGS